MISWEEYLTSLLDGVRSGFRAFFKIPEFAREDYIRWQAHYPFVTAFLETCQISVICFKKDPNILWILTKHYDEPDKKIHAQLETKKSVEEYLKKEFPNFRMMMGYFSHRSPTKPNEKVGIEWAVMDEHTIIYALSYDPREEPIENLITSILGNLSRDYVYDRMKDSTDSLRKIIEQVVDSTLKDKLFVATEEIQNAMEQARRIDEHERKLAFIENEIGGVRKIIGTTKEFQDFRIFTTDVSDLKKSHIHKDIFITEIKRLDEKIDKEIESQKTRIDALNTRIDDLKAIKFWSRRTLLEIALAIWGAIITLYATGIIKF